MSSSPIIPYDGPLKVHSGPMPTDPEQAARITTDAAVKFSQSFPEFERNAKRGQNPLDDATAGALNEWKRQMRATPPKPACVFNLNPFTLDFGMGDLYLRGIVVPAWSPGMPYPAKHVIRHPRHESFYNEDGSRGFKTILPIHMAAEFLREYSHKDNYGGGVIICEGDVNPEKAGPDFEVELYDPMGRPIIRLQQGIEYDAENNPVPVELEIPIKRKLSDQFEEARKSRNAFYRKQVQKAEHDWRLPDGRGKQNVTAVHDLMADILVAEGLLAKKPDWNLTSRLEEGLAGNDCKACGSTPKLGAYKCVTCGNILNALEAYKDFAIEFDHGKMAMLTSDELEEAELVKMEREDVKPAKKAKKT